ncbi:hypothetical protein DQ384_11795 [Sphaerisporangium album]|uniref:Uncharacterized protein n=1 Tax=Sphaerisporangium album TaxID=509200 RepID=A0A367FLV4_9ACTN|nr:hypothetical protein DQ384_11795 [Sphaerisporangium album]
MDLHSETAELFDASRGLHGCVRRQLVAVHHQCDTLESPESTMLLLGTPIRVTATAAVFDDQPIPIDGDQEILMPEYACDCLEKPSVRGVVLDEDHGGQR